MRLWGGHFLELLIWCGVPCRLLAAFAAACAALQGPELALQLQRASKVLLLRRQLHLAPKLIRLELLRRARLALCCVGLVRVGLGLGLGLGLRLGLGLGLRLGLGSGLGLGLGLGLG